MKELDDLWNKAERNPGHPIPVGRLVVCDSCSEDFTDSPLQGGLIFQSKAICPTCAPTWEQRIQEFGEERLIRMRCRSGQTFGDFVRAYRGPNAAISFTPLSVDKL